MSRADAAQQRREEREAEARVDPAAAAGRAIMRGKGRRSGRLDVEAFTRALREEPPAPLRGGVPVNVRVPDALDVKLEKWCAAHQTTKRAVLHQLLVELLGETR